MSSNTNPGTPPATDYGVRRVRDDLHDTLRSYVEASYHVRDESLIRERHALLLQPGSIVQKPFIEATPVYEQVADAYDKLKHVPAAARELLKALSQLRNPSVGVFPRPYVHQVRALEAFLGRGEDLIVSTGTGSGKTETFLMNILGQLVVEAKRSPRTAKKRGLRALLLYPMNALVSDQLARIRRLFGDPRVADELEAQCGRRIRFGMYTSRTPYPGPRDGEKDARHMRLMFEGFYLEKDAAGNWCEAAARKALLQAKGKWPCKDLLAFFGQPGQQWKNRLVTQPADTELLTRHEMHLCCPDLLITNYSMLEYMMMRPIERGIFKDTIAWLESDPKSSLILVLDEAHTYRGAGGAEVALLIRRLQARLRLPRERFRCILTSASLGDPADVERFARDLTGLPAASKHTFCPPITGQRESRPVPRPGTPEEAAALAAFDRASFQNYALRPDAATAAVADLAVRLGWPAPPADDLAQYLFDRLTGWGPVEQLIARVSGDATEFTSLTQKLFPAVPPAEAEPATEALLGLATFARRRADDRVLVPTRLHLFFRGLPAQFACTNRKCSARLDTTAESYLLGRLHTLPRLHCPCGCRTYELITHRRCGTAFLRGYLEGPSGNFLWHEPSGLAGLDPLAPLTEVQLLIQERHPEAVTRNEVVEAWLDPATGRLETTRPSEPDAWLRVHLPTLGAHQPDPRHRQFVVCPVCRKKCWRAKRSDIMDLVTKGEAPFSNLVKTQVRSQPPQREEKLEFPNGGRKSLLFSDGRQKAARLARDIPREVELDSFRTALALAVKALEAEGTESRPIHKLYVAFVSVAATHFLAYFDGDSQKHLLTHIRDFANTYGGDLHVALDDMVPNPVPPRYQEALLRQLCSRFYSLAYTTLGFVGPARTPLNNFRKELATPLAGDADGIAIAWMLQLLQEDLAFDANTSDSMREIVAGYDVKGWGGEGRLPAAVRELLGSHADLARAQVEQLEQRLRQFFCGPAKNGEYRLDPGKVRIVIDLDRPWHYCRDCTFLSPVTILGRCINCAGNRVEALDPRTDPYIRSRKGFFRQPVERCLAGQERPVHVCAEEHTAQLSHRDEGVVHATTERHELRFQDIILDQAQDEGPIDVLSCTTTMEVGVDIGSLVAVGLRNVPPQRENYQQRAGRAGRRGSAVSTVLTFSQEGPHDSYYYANPYKIISDPPRKPKVHANNPRIARRHVHAYLLQTFFHETLDRGVQPPGGAGGGLDTALGMTTGFFLGTDDPGFTLPAFRAWIQHEILPAKAARTAGIVAWLPPGIDPDPAAWVRQTAQDLLGKLGQRAKTLSAGGEAAARAAQLLLDDLFDQGILPTYAFPTDLASFLVEGKDGYRIVEKEKPQQGINQALSEYAPGRLVVIDKVTYRSGGVTASTLATEPNRAAPLFSRQRDYVFCPDCSFVHVPHVAGDVELAGCPLCGRTEDLSRASMITPEVFYPEHGQPVNPTDRDQDLTYASSAQFPQPVADDDDADWHPVGEHGQIRYAIDQPLVVVNRGDEETNDGFLVCDHCGQAGLASKGEPPYHRRPYLIQVPPRQPHPGKCPGIFRNVFLGNLFRSDLMLLRITLKPPFGQNLADRVFRVAVEDALRSLAEGLLKAASLHLDIDPGEFSAGFRLLPRHGKRFLRADVYLFDNLSGGAGYAEQAGQEIDAVLLRLTDVLTKCPNDCETSCQGCLRHYGNRFWHESLDRWLALSLLSYLRDGNAPPTTGLGEQARRLESLRRMLELDGYQARTAAVLDGQFVPLLVTRDDHSVAVGTYHGLLDENAPAFSHPLEVLDGRRGVTVRLVNDYRLTRNLPAAYQEVRDLL
jgi:ATP-dependent helicase YprA (DUF1998 family)